jgi:Flp pilus assembly protein TadD
MPMNFLRTIRGLLCVLPLFLAGCASDEGLMKGFGANKAADNAAVAEYTTYEAALASAKGSFREGNYGHAEAAFQRAVELNANSAEAWLGLAASYDRLRRFDLADRAYAGAATWLAASPEYYNNLGYSFMLRGDLPKARENFLKAAELDPGNVVVAHNLDLLKAGAADL